MTGCQLCLDVKLIDRSKHSLQIDITRNVNHLGPFQKRKNDTIGGFNFKKSFEKLAANSLIGHFYNLPF